MEGATTAETAMGRNVPVAVLVGVALAGLGLLCFRLGAVTTTALIAVVLTASAVEFFSAVRAAGYNPATLLGLVSTASLAIAPLAKPALAYPVIGAITLISGMVWYLWVSPGKGAVTDLGVTLLGIGWIGGLGSFATYLLGVGRLGEDAFDLDSNPGIGILLGAILVSVSYDVGGFFVGKYFGRTPLSEVSPNKTQEGLIGGFFAALFVPFIILKFLPGVAPLGDNAATRLRLLPLLRAVRSRRRPVSVDDQARPRHQGHGFDPPGPWWGARPLRRLLFVLPVAWFMAHILGVETVQGFVF